MVPFAYRSSLFATRVPYFGGTALGHHTSANPEAHGAGCGGVSVEVPNIPRRDPGMSAVGSCRSGRIMVPYRADTEIGVVNQPVRGQTDAYLWISCRECPTATGGQDRFANRA